MQLHTLVSNDMVIVVVKLKKNYSKKVLKNMNKNNTFDMPLHF